VVGSVGASSSWGMNVEAATNLTNPRSKFLRLDQRNYLKLCLTNVCSVYYIILKVSDHTREGLSKACELRFRLL